MSLHRCRFCSALFRAMLNILLAHGKNSRSPEAAPMESEPVARSLGRTCAASSSPSSFEFDVLFVVCRQSLLSWHWYVSVILSEERRTPPLMSYNDDGG